LSGPSLDLIASIRPLQLCADGGYQLRLGVLGVPLIKVPDSSPRASKGVLILAWRLLSHFFARGPAFLGCVSFRWVRTSAPAGCSPQASEEWFDSFEVLMRFAMLRRSGCSLMRTSPGAQSSPKFSGWYVDAVNGLAGAGFARAAPEPLHRARGRSRTYSTFLHTPLRRLSARRRGGKRHVALGEH
jgi:hypothetical protein